MIEERWAAEDDAPDGDDNRSFEEDDGIVPCPYCGGELLEESPQCPACGKYISAEDLPPQHKPSWILIGVILSLIAALVWLAGV